MLASSRGSADPRLDERSNVFLSASILSASGSVPARIRNICSMGAMLDGACLPDEGKHVSLVRGKLEAKAEVVWRSGDYRGIRFALPVDVDAWVSRVSHGGQQRVDRAVAASYAGTAAASPSVGYAVEAKSIEEFSRDLLSICERMASSPDLTVGIGEDVMKIEAIAISLMKLGSSR